MISEETRKRWRYKISAVEEQGVGLTAWEEEFIDSISIQLFTYNRDLSMKQSMILNRIFEERIL
jgi:hypothetical protein